MKVGRGTVRAYLEGLRGISIVSGATEHTYREPLVTFLVAASAAKTFISCVTPMPLTINATTATISAREVRVPVQ
jgi:hypothetical protein